MTDTDLVLVAGLRDRVRRRLVRWRQAGLGPGLVVAVSGGGDSVGLLRLLHELAPELGLRLVVAHLDHGVRGEAAVADARFVAELARHLGWPCDLGRWKPERAGHFEADARRARYAWLATVARGRGATAVAVGQTRDDQAETILHRILRGTGLRGLAGMPERRALDERIELIRPVLGASRAELRTYLKIVGQDYREDASNADLTRTRSRLRHDLLPRLASEYNPRVSEALVRLGNLASMAIRLQDIQVRQAEESVILEVRSGEVRLARRALTELDVGLRTELLRRVWRKQGWPEQGMTARHWRRLAALVLLERARVSLGGGIDLECQPGGTTLRQRKNESPELSQPVELPIPGIAPWKGGRLVATLDENDPRDETIDLDRVVPPLIVRGPRAGDRFDPLGLGGHTQALSDHLRSRRVKRDSRPSVPLVCDDAGIVWVVGHRIADRVKISANTTRYLGLRWQSP